MPMPALAKTYEFDTNRPWYLSTTSFEVAARQLSMLIKDQWLDQSHHGIGGTIAEVSAGVTYSLQINPGDVAGNILVTGSENFTTALIGKYVEFSGASNGGNNGVFQITGVPAADTIEFANVGGVAEPGFLGNFRISRGNITSGAGGQMSPWRCQGSGAGTTGRGSGHDGKDRWIDEGDFQSSTSVSGNKSWFCFENTVTGCQWLLSHDTNSSTYEYCRANILASPELGFSGGTASVQPSAADQQYCVNNADWLGGETSLSQTTHYGNLIVSTDGEQTIYFAAKNGGIHFGSMACVPVVHVDFATANIPWTGNQNLFMWESYVDTVFWTIDSLTDTARFRGTIDHLGANGGPFVSAMILTSENIGATLAPENQPNRPDDLTPRQYPFNQLGVFSATAGVRGRLGYLQDIWAINENHSVGLVPQGSNFPGTTARTRLKLGHYAIPWDGSKLRMR